MIFVKLYVWEINDYNWIMWISIDRDISLISFCRQWKKKKNCTWILRVIINIWMYLNLRDFNDKTSFKIWESILIESYHENRLHWKTFDAKILMTYNIFFSLIYCKLIYQRVQNRQSIIYKSKLSNIMDSLFLKKGISQSPSFTSISHPNHHHWFNRNSHQTHFFFYLNFFDGGACQKPHKKSVMPDRPPFL